LASGTVKKQRLGAAAGILTPILAFTCILVAIASYPSFSWTNNALSDLGIVKGYTGPLFNFGLYASGFLGLVFAVFGLLSYIGKTFLGRVGAALFFAATLALIAIGVFNESYSGIHFAVSAAFFVLAPISLFVITCAFWFSHKKRAAVFSLGTGVVAALPWILQLTFNYVPKVAIPETISALVVSAWTIAVSYKILKQAKG
jgi:hypothetical membrane protein